jgi:hypothetical protein
MDYIFSSISKIRPTSRFDVHILLYQLNKILTFPNKNGHFVCKKSFYKVLLIYLNVLVVFLFSTTNKKRNTIKKVVIQQFKAMKIETVLLN